MSTDKVGDKVGVAMSTALTTMHSPDGPLTAAEVRELWAFLHGDIMVGGIRDHLRRSMGLCPRHTWGYAQVEIELWIHGRGDRGGHQPFDVCVLYGALLGDVVLRLRGRHAPWTHDLRAIVAPTDTCRVCDVLRTAGTASPSPGLPARDADVPGYGGFDMGRLTTEANAAIWTAQWCRETEPVWRERACARCTEEIRPAPSQSRQATVAFTGEPGSVSRLCRLHLASQPLRPVEAREIAETLTDAQARMLGLVRSMTMNGPTATAEQNASWVEALGWFAGWSLPLKLAATAAPHEN